MFEVRGVLHELQSGRSRVQQEISKAKCTLFNIVRGLEFRNSKAFSQLSMATGETWTCVQVCVLIYKKGFTGIGGSSKEIHW